MGPEHGPTDENAPTLLTQAAKYSDRVVSKTEVRGASSTQGVQDEVQETLALSSATVPTDLSLERFAGTWFQKDGTRMGQIEGNVMTWACDLPAGELRLSPSGE